MPLEHALRHLANDAALPSHVRDIAKTVLTGGPDRDGGMIPTGLWALGDQLEEIGHPLARHEEGGYNWRSAGDKVELDKHVGTAFEELAAAWHRQFPGEPRTHDVGRGDPSHLHGKNRWHFSPESFAQSANLSLDGGPDPAGVHKGAVNYIKTRVSQLHPTASGNDIEESIRRHAHRAQHEWNQRMQTSASVTAYVDAAKAPYVKPWKGGKPVGHKLNELAARYRRKYAKPFDGKPVRVAGFNPEPNFFPEERSDLLGSLASTQRSFTEQARRGLQDRTGMLPGLSEVKALATAGEPARGGYRETRRTIEDVLRDPVLADRFVTANAILSAQTGWEAHTAGAIEALAAHREGLRNKLTLDQVFGRSTPDGKLIRGTFKGPDTYTATKAEALKRLFAKAADEGGVEWGDISKGGYKTPNFGLAFVDPRGTPIDTHMGKLLVPGDGFDLRMMHRIGSDAGVPSEFLTAAKLVRDRVVGKTATHLAYKTLLAKAANDLGWEPREVQEAVWTATVAAMLSKHLGSGPRAAQILGKLNRRAVQAGWSLNSVLTNPEVVRDLTILGSSPRKIAAAIRASEKRTPAGPGDLRTGDPAAFESAVSRLPAERVKAAGPIAARLRRRVIRMARPGEETLRQIIAAINAGGADATAHAAYADFLEENGLPGAHVVRENARWMQERGHSRVQSPRVHIRETFPDVSYPNMDAQALMMLTPTPKFRDIREPTPTERRTLALPRGYRGSVVSTEEGVFGPGHPKYEEGRVEDWATKNAASQEYGLAQLYRDRQVPGVYIGLRHAHDTAANGLRFGNGLTHWAYAPDLDSFHRLTADFPGWAKKMMIKQSGANLKPRKPKTPPAGPVSMHRKCTASAPARYASAPARGDFMDALRRVRSSNIQALHHAARDAARQLGLDPVQTRDALHDGPTGSTPGIAQAVYGPASPESIHRAAAIYALAGNQPGVAVFHARPNGPDSLYRFRFEGAGLEIRHRMDRAGLRDRVLIPHEKGFDVLVPDRGGRNSSLVRQFAKDQRVELEHSRGHFAVLGDRDLAAAREKYRGVVRRSRPRRYAGFKPMKPAKIDPREIDWRPGMTPALPPPRPPVPTFDSLGSRVSRTPVSSASPLRPADSSTRLAQERANRWAAIQSERHADRFMGLMNLTDRDRARNVLHGILSKVASRAVLGGGAAATLVPGAPGGRDIRLGVKWKGKFSRVLMLPIRRAMRCRS
jgi:hypothetical protein